VFLRMNTTA